MQTQMQSKIQLRKSSERGVAEHGWLHSRFSFSFADYHDPRHMGFSVLRVINEDHIDGKSGFPSHPHRDMEIVSFVIDGELVHQDSMGNKTVIRPGEIQRMSAGTGVVHSEYNGVDRQTHLLQIWIVPDRAGYPPSYEQKNYEAKFAKADFALLASNTGREDSISLHQDVDIYLGKSAKAASVTHRTSGQRSLWFQVIRGDIEVNGSSLHSGDGLAVQGAEEAKISAQPGSEYLLFDMPV